MSQLAYRAADPMSIRSILNERDQPQSRSNLRLPQMPLPPMDVPERGSDMQIYYSNTSRGPQSPYSTSGYSTASFSSASPTWCPPQTPMPSSASRRGSVARAPRPKYSDDQGYFIWYHRTDLAEPWDKVLQEFEKQFNHPRPKGGLQCKFYRLLDDWRVEKVRAQARQAQNGSRDRVGKYGLVQRTSLRFTWMKPEHFDARPLQQFSNLHKGSPGSSPCPGCDDCR